MNLSKTLMSITNVTAEKVTVAGMLAALAIWLEWLLIPLVILIVAMTIDYITGLRAAKYRSEKVDSAKFAKGIEKKVMLLALVGVGLLIDALLLYCSSAFGVEMPIKFIVAVVIAVWLTVNELISILENIKDTGADIPIWLLPLIKNLKSKVENIQPQIDKEDKDNG